MGLCYHWSRGKGINITGNERVGWQFQNTERKKRQPRVLYPAMLSWNKGEIKTSPEKKKVEGIHQ